MAYVSHNPFLLEDDSIVDNIIFGRSFNQNRLDDAMLASGIRAEQMEMDVRKVMSELRVRIGLARAIYSNSDVILCDDVFRNVERPAVRREIYEKIKCLRYPSIIYATSRREFFSEDD